MSIKKFFALASIVVASGIANGATVIDTFDNASLLRSAPPAANGDAFGTSTSGFARTLTSTASGNFVDTAINSTTTPGKLSHSQGAGVFGSSLVTYALGGLNLSEGGMANAFRIQLDSVDLNGILGVVVNGTSTVTLNTTQILITNSFALPSYADFLFSGFSGVDFSSVTSVGFLIDGTNTAALDATVDNFGTVCSALEVPGGIKGVSGGAGANPAAGNCATVTHVPEPGSISLIGLALFGLGAARRYTKKA